MKRLLHKGILLGATAACASLLVPPVLAGDPEDCGPFYEDQAWSQITKWFDGNGYSRTAEGIWLGDDEAVPTTHLMRNLDRDRDYGSYGYLTTNPNDDWFYDYYNLAFVWPTNDESGVIALYDFNGDGIYDGYTLFRDDEIEFYRFNSAADERMSAHGSQALENDRVDTKHRIVSGKIDKTKLVQVNGIEHLVVSLTPDMREELSVDLGEQKPISRLNLSKGEQITVRGPTVHMGNKQLVLAQSITSEGHTTTIDRQRKEIRGEITSTRTAMVRENQKHLMAIVKSKSGDKHLAVDLGPADAMNMRLSKGDKIAISGPIVRVDDRLVLLANTVDHNGQVAQIDRGGGPRVAAGTRSESDR